jgi:hypothetical protein
MILRTLSKYNQDKYPNHWINWLAGRLLRFMELQGKKTRCGGPWAFQDERSTGELTSQPSETQRTLIPFVVVGRKKSSFPATAYIHLVAKNEKTTVATTP